MTKASDNQYPSVLFTEQASNPTGVAASQHRLFYKTDGLLYDLDGDTGAVSKVMGTGSQVAIITVAANDSSAYAKTRATYVCDGVADQNEINTALAAIPSTGGKVILLEGTFNITAPVLVKLDSTTLEGMGVGTRDDATQVGRGTWINVSAGLTGTAVLVQRNANDRPVFGAIVRNFTVDGSLLTGSGSIDGITFRCNQGLYEDVYIHRMSGNGLVIKGYSGWNTYDTRIINPLISYCHGHGILMSDNAPDCHIICPIILSNDGNGIHITSASLQIVGGQLYDNDRNIYFDNAGSQTHISAIKLENAHKDCIYFDATNTGISNVLIGGCGFRLNCKEVTNTYDVIGGTGTNGCSTIVIVGNRFNSNTATDPDLPRYGINMWGNAVQNWTVVGNSMARAYANHWGTAPINYNGSSSSPSLVRANGGAANAGSQGNATISQGGTSVTVTHNLAYTPTAQEISITPTNNPATSPGNYWVDTITSTQFNINVRNTMITGTATFSWHIG